MCRDVHDWVVGKDCEQEVKILGKRFADILSVLLIVWHQWIQLLLQQLCLSMSLVYWVDIRFCCLHSDEDEWHWHWIIVEQEFSAAASLIHVKSNQKLKDLIQEDDIQQQIQEAVFLLYQGNFCDCSHVFKEMPVWPCISVVNKTNQDVREGEVSFSHWLRHNCWWEGIPNHFWVLYEESVSPISRRICWQPVAVFVCRKLFGEDLAQRDL